MAEPMTDEEEDAWHKYVFNLSIPAAYFTKDRPPNKKERDEFLKRYRANQEVIKDMYRLRAQKEIDDGHL